MPKFTYWEYSASESENIVPQYSNGNVRVACLSTNVESNGMQKQYASCLLTADVDRGFLVERCNLQLTTNEKGTELGTFTSQYPGQVFREEPKIGVVQNAFALCTLNKEQNWLTFSSSIIDEDVVYENRNLTVTHQVNGRTVVIIPIFGVVIAISTVCVAILSRISLHFLFGTTGHHLTR